MTVIEVLQKAARRCREQPSRVIMWLELDPLGLKIRGHLRGTDYQVMRLVAWEALEAGGDEFLGWEQKYAANALLHRLPR